ncbi:MAG: hypothetical protein LAO23_22480, partial [Acidobacteriia bacterium]|nr:hypothetical protein [Terriglobia bacterium]
LKLKIERKQFDTSAPGRPMRVVQNTLASRTLTALPGEVFDDPEPYYSVAVIDWTQTYVPRQEERAKLGMKPDESLPAKDKKVCATMKENNTANVQEGIDNLNKALQLRPDYDDAMAYMNLMYRERADIQCDDPGARSTDLKTADEWVDKTMAIKKQKAEKQAGQGGIVMDQNK